MGTEWTAITDSTPPPEPPETDHYWYDVYDHVSVLCLVVTENGYIALARLVSSDDDDHAPRMPWRQTGEGYELNNVTHWIATPPPPPATKENNQQ